jgi:hypothetical protein
MANRPAVSRINPDGAILEKDVAGRTDDDTIAERRVNENPPGGERLEMVNLDIWWWLR